MVIHGTFTEIPLYEFPASISEGTGPGEHTLAPDGFAVEAAFDAAVLAQDHRLAPADMDFEIAVEPVTMSQDHALSPESMVFESHFEEVSWFGRAVARIKMMLRHHGDITPGLRF